MKKNKHPKTYSTEIIMTNGATFSKNWIFLKRKLLLDVDFLKHKLWKSSKKIYNNKK
jgi:ribosomal protein L31